MRAQVFSLFQTQTELLPWQSQCAPFLFLIYTNQYVSSRTISYFHQENLSRRNFRALSTAVGEKKYNRVQLSFESVNDIHIKHAHF